jgi:hypothetical protein
LKIRHRSLAAISGIRRILRIQPTPETFLRALTHGIRTRDSIRSFDVHPGSGSNDIRGPAEPPQGHAGDEKDQRQKQAKCFA